MNKGMTPGEIAGDEGTIRDQLEELVARWLRGRTMAPLGFR